MSQIPWHGQSVLIVDDSLVAREQLQSLYRELGMTIAGTVVNGVEGLEAIATLKPDLVSLDINMPEMDGIECYRLLMKEFPEQKVAMISWLASDIRLVDALKHIVPSHIFGSKPITREALKILLGYVYGMIEQDRLNLDDKDTLGGPSHQMPTYTHKVG